MQKTILFLSALDFKEKSIQVIRKTPEAYVRHGWEVHYVVARDESKHGSYFYERVVDCEGVCTYRFKWPLQWLRDRITSRIPLIILTKLISIFAVFRLAWVGAKILRSTHIDIIYGYEVHGVLAMNLLGLLSNKKGIKKVARFQGTFLHGMLEAKEYHRIIFNTDLCIALWLPSDLCLMTNDGTEGDKAFKKINPMKKGLLKFWVNGVDQHWTDRERVKEIQRELQLNKDKTFVSISRLVCWKRVDRAIKVFSVLKNEYGLDDFKYLIIGEGQEREALERLVESLGLWENVIFVGSVPNSEIKNYLESCKFFVSTYDASNVGNPLLEAIRAKKIIFTLNNGDTGSWIDHKVNGFIYDVNGGLFAAMAKDMHDIMMNPDFGKKIVEGVDALSNSRLWTWEERLDAEVNAVESLIA